MGSVRLVVATHNPGKRAEFARLFFSAGVELFDLDDFPGGEEAPDEWGTTYAENARLKARAASRLTGLPSLADDSGLEVEVLGGEPGIHSARYGGPGLDDRGRIERLLEVLREVPDARRAAQFVCDLVIAAPDGRIVREVQARLAGRVTRAPRGEDGFGYDPVFFVPSLGGTLAEVGARAKDAVSHRGRAVQLARTGLENLLQSLDRIRISA